jgi:hypothetical protein
MNRTLLTLVTFFAVSAARAADIATTFHFNPTLSHEANPIVACFGAGASTLLLTNLLATFLFLFVPLYCFWRFPAAPMPSTPANLREFVCLQLYGRVLPHGEFCCAIFLGMPLPKKWLQLLRFCGVALSWTIVFGSCLAVFSWWALWEWRWQGFNRIWAASCIGGYPTIIFFPIGVFYYAAAYMYFRREFALFKNGRSSLTD